MYFFLHYYLLHILWIYLQKSKKNSYISFKVLLSCHISDCPRVYMFFSLSYYHYQNTFCKNPHCFQILSSVIFIWIIKKNNNRGIFSTCIWTTVEHIFKIIYFRNDIVNPLIFSFSAYTWWAFQNIILLWKLTSESKG